MNGIKCADWLEWKCLSGTIQHGCINFQDCPPCRGVAKTDSIVDCLEFGHGALHDAPRESSPALGNRQPRRDDRGGVPQVFVDLLAPRLIKEPRQDGAGFCVENQRSPRSQSMNSCDVPAGVRMGRSGYRSGVFGPPSRALPCRANSMSPGGAQSAPFWDGAASCATTLPRSVTRIVSPRPTRRTYSLRRFFNSRMPTVVMSLL